MLAGPFTAVLPTVALVQEPFFQYYAEPWAEECWSAISDPFYTIICSLRLRDQGGALGACCASPPETGMNIQRCAPSQLFFLTMNKVNDMNWMNEWRIWNGMKCGNEKWGACGIKFGKRENPKKFWQYPPQLTPWRHRDPCRVRRAVQLLVRLDWNHANSQCFLTTDYTNSMDIKQFRMQIVYK